MDAMPPLAKSAQEIHDAMYPKNEPKRVREQVYCKDCKYLKTHVYLYHPGDDPLDSHYCTHPNNALTSCTDTPLARETFTYYQRIKIANANNDCTLRDTKPQPEPQPAPPLTFLQRITAWWKG